MRKLGKVGIGIGIVFLGLLSIGIVASILDPTPPGPPKKVVEVQKPKPEKKVVKKKAVKKKTQALKLEEIGNKQGEYLITQCYATNQSGKTWKNYVQVSMSDTKGKVLYYSWDHCWANVKLAPGERDYFVAKIPLPKQRPFIIEWEWGKYKLLITYR